MNVENASYPVGTCAERCAISTAVAAGFSRVIAVVVSTDIKSPASPCGMCRQFMREFLVSGDVLVVMMGSNDIEGGVVRRFEEVSIVSQGMSDDVLIQSVVVANEFWAGESRYRGVGRA